MRSQTDQTKKRYDRIAPVFNQMDRMIRKRWRQELLSGASGHVLEVGVGTGANLPFYPGSVQTLTGIDLSPKMLGQAKKKRSAVFAELLEMDAEHLQFPDHSFDTVVSTCVFCSVPDPVQGLKEIKRVLKPGGTVLMLEHMRSEGPLLGKLMDAANPLVVRMWGANINRRTMDNIRAAGLQVQKETRLMGSVMRELVITKPRDEKKKNQ